MSIEDIPVVLSGLVPGRPSLPELVSPKQLTARKLHTPESKAAFILALAHIEFNAIKLALDAVYRFREMPNAFYTDWSKVAVEEAHHFELLSARLSELGYAYGDFPVHDSLWEMAIKTETGVLERMAMVPRVYEALLKREGNRLVMLGTPNRGSYSVARLLLGHDRLARLLALLDFKHDLKSILKVLIHFPGILEMLPAASAENDFDLFDINSWKCLQQTSPDHGRTT